MNNDELQSCMVTNSFQEAVEYYSNRTRETARFMDRISLTPNGMYAVEREGVYGTEFEARRANCLTMPLVLVSIANLLPSTYAAITVSALVHRGSIVGALVGWPIFLTLMIAVPLLLTKVATRIAGTPHPVTHAMAIAWNRARLLIEDANDENTVPAILDHMMKLEAELRFIYTCYGSIVNAVDREQMECDFVQACATVETLAQAAREVRDELYSTRRRQYLSLDA